MVNSNNDISSSADASRDERVRGVVVAVIRDGQSVEQTEEFLGELEFLAETADIVSVRRFTQRLPQPSSRIYVGPGKLEEIAAYCAENEIDVVIFDDELSPSQTRNIEKAMPCRILDRTRLILDIFMSRARTAYAKTQVQLAQYEYMLPRLAGMWTHLERQRGGTGTRGGAGEKPVYLVFNKIDAYTYVKKDEDDLTPATRRNMSLDDLRRSWIAKANTPCIFISAAERTNIDKLRSDLYGMVREIHAGRYPFNNFLY